MTRSIVRTIGFMQPCRTVAFG